MGLSRVKQVLTSRPVFLAGGVAVVFLAASVVWIELATPLGLRLPIPSPDGKFFAYFDLVRPASHQTPSGYDLVVSSPRGRLMARFGMGQGSILWSSADHLAVFHENLSQVTLIANSEGRFLTLTRLILSRGTEPRWSSDGTKLAYVRPGTSGEEIAVYDFQQTLAFVVPVPPKSRLWHPTLLFWSPGSQELFYLNTEGTNLALERVHIPTGTVQILARGLSSRRNFGVTPPRLSPDGGKIYLPPPLHAVIDSRTGEMVWHLPSQAKVLWSPWSADGCRLFYSRNVGWSGILAHDFARRADLPILTHAPSNGFLTPDGHSYFYRARRVRGPKRFLSGLGEWLNQPWGWQDVDVVTQSAQPLGRQELFPWEQTQEGWILARRDDYLGIQFGLYDPNGRVWSEYVFPTAGYDFLQQVKEQIVVLFSVVLCAVLGFFVYLKRPGSAPARALYLVSLLFMLLFASLGGFDPARSAPPAFAYPETAREMALLGWLPTGLFYPLAFDIAFLFLISLMLAPPAVFHLAMAVPEGNPFLARQKAVCSLLYGVSLLPLLLIVAIEGLHRAPDAPKPLVFGSLFAAGALAVLPALLALDYNLSHPAGSRAREQVRWVAMAFGLPVVVMDALLLGSILLSDWSRFVGKPPPHFLDSVGALAPLLWSFTLLAVSYALLAPKPFHVHLFVRRAFHYSLLAFVVIAVYLLLLGGLTLLVTGSMEHPSSVFKMVSALLTAFILIAARARLQCLIDQTLDRRRYEFREGLRSFAEELPHIVDRQTLATRFNDGLQEAMGSQGVYVFVLDRLVKKLRLLSAEDGLPASAAAVEFDPAEPLCRYLLTEKRVFDAEVPPEDSKGASIFRSAAERLRKLNAAVVFGFERQGELLGFMVLAKKTSGEFYNTEDLELLSMVADQAAQAIDKTALPEEVACDSASWREKGVAPDIQARLAHRVLVRLNACQVAGRCLPAGSASGDYYDFLQLPGDKIGVAICDVSRKGVEASLLVDKLRELVRAQAHTAESPAALVGSINRQLYAASGGVKYCTFFYGVFDGAQRKFDFVNAGHHPPLILANGAVRFLESTGLPLGLFPEVTHETACTFLEPGAVLLLYSDSITEPRNKQGEIYGVDRLVSTVSQVADLDAAGLVEKILSNVRKFCAGTSIEDDQTLILFKIDPA